MTYYIGKITDNNGNTRTASWPVSTIYDVQTWAHTQGSGYDVMEEVDFMEYRLIDANGNEARLAVEYAD